MVRLIRIVIQGYLTAQCCMDPHVQPIYRTVGNNFLSSKAMPPYLHYGKELFASWSRHTRPDWLFRSRSIFNLPSWDIWDGGGVHDLYPFPATTLPELELQLVESWQRLLQGGVQMYTQASSKRAQKTRRMH